MHAAKGATGWEVTGSKEIKYTREDGIIGLSEKQKDQETNELSNFKVTWDIQKFKKSLRVSQRGSS